MSSGNTVSLKGSGNLLKDAVVEATRKVMQDKPDMDLLKLRSNDAIKELIKKEGSAIPERIECSCKVTKINRKGRNQDRYLMITNKAIYNLKPKKYKQSQRRVLISKVGMVTLSSMSPEFVIHVTDEYDYHFSSKQKDNICEVLQDLFEVVATGKELLVVYSPLKHLKDIVLTKKLAKFEKKDKKFEMKQKIAAKSMKNIGADAYVDDDNDEKQKPYIEYDQPGASGQSGQPGQGQGQMQPGQYGNMQPQNGQNNYNQQQQHNNNQNQYGNQYNQQQQYNNQQQFNNQKQQQYNNNQGGYNQYQQPQQQQFNGYGQQQMNGQQMNGQQMNQQQYNNNQYGQYNQNNQYNQNQNQYNNQH